MLYQLGEIEFLRPLDGPTSFAKTKSANFAEMERIEGPPTLQKLGGVLTTIELDMYLHHSFTNVRQALNKFDAALDAGESLTLINGLGDVEGDFVITDLRTIYEGTDDVGRLMSASITVSLKEFVPADPAQADRAKAKKAGFANLTSNPVISTPVNKFQTPQISLMQDIVETQTNARSASASIKKAASLPALAKTYTSQALKALTKAKTAATKARNGVDAAASKISNAAALKSNLESVISSVTSISTTISGGTVSDGVAVTASIDSNINTLMTTAAHLTQVIVLRK